MRIAGTLSASVMAGALIGSALAASNIYLSPEAIGKPPIDSWTTFNGDYTGQRYSTLTQITPANVSKIGEQWVYKITGVGSQRGRSEPVIKCTPLLINGVLYITIP